MHLGKYIQYSYSRVLRTYIQTYPGARAGNKLHGTDLTGRCRDGRRAKVSYRREGLLRGPAGLTKAGTEIE